MKKINKPTDDAVVISCQLIDMLKDKGGKDWADLMSLYAFYFRCGKRQKTNQPWVTNKFASKGLRWGADKLQTRKTELKKLGLIDTIRTKRKDGTYGKPYVKVSYMWGQSQTEETPEIITTTSVISRQVATEQQMLKVVKNKCLNLGQKEERRKGDSTNPQNPNNTCTVIQEPSGLSPNAGDVQTSEVKSSATNSLVSTKNENKPGFMSCDTYKEVMLKRFKDLCGIDGVHILHADLASNTRRLNWSKQVDYWEKRLSGIDALQTEAWRLIAVYLRVFRFTNGYYPDMRSFLQGWRAIDWKVERERIVSHCKTHNADIAMKNYVEMRAEEGTVVKVKWLLSVNDYSRWLRNSEKDIDGRGDASDDFENRASGGPKSLQEWEERHAEGLRIEEARERRKRMALDLIQRARKLGMENDDEAFKQKIANMLNVFKEYGDLDRLKQSVEALESSQQRREVKT
jgi:hypothetical protein